MPQPDDRLPHNTDAERAALGCILIDQDAARLIGTVIQPADFYQERHGWIFSAMQALDGAGTPPDYIAVCDELERRGHLDNVGGPAYLTGLIEGVPSSLYAEHYAGIVQRDAVRRAVIRHASEIAAKAYQTKDAAELLAAFNQAAIGLTLRGETSGLLSAREVFADFWTDLEYWETHPLPPNTVRGLSTGLPTWDRMMDGMAGGDFVIIAGRPRMGKTALTLTSAHRIARAGYRVAFFALEMTRKRLIARLAAAESGVPFSKIKHGVKETGGWYATPDEWAAFIAAGLKISDLSSLYIDETPGLSVAEIRARASALAHRLGGLDLVVVDTGNLVGGEQERGMNFAQSESAKTRALRNLAKELDCVVYMTWQLRKEVDSRPVSNYGQRPTLADMRDTGGVEEHATDVIAVYRDEVVNDNTTQQNVMELIGLKRRDDEGNTIARVRYDARVQRFSELELRGVAP